MGRGKEPNQKEKGHVDTENILFPCMCSSALILYSFPIVLCLAAYTFSTF